MAERVKKQSPPTKPLISKIIKAKNLNYEETLSPPLIDSDLKEFLDIRTVPTLVEALKKNERLDIDARVFMFDKRDGVATRKRLTKDRFIEAFKFNARKQVFRESIDSFLMGGDGAQGSLIGKDQVPLLGGPFNKQLYLQDMLAQHTQAFYAFNHDPVGHRICKIIRDFVLGRGWRVDCKNPEGMALWKAFEEVNNLTKLVDQFVLELSIYGEHFAWWLPNNQKFISYQVMPGQEPPRGLIPRIRLIDPSVIWEIVTYPEDISRVLYYQWVAPTQYQIYTGSDAGKPVSGLKFIYQQLPPDQVMHYKVNAVSNEKRGRSDLFPVLGYLKRLRDSVNYSIIGMQKATAWSIDTQIEGSQTDIDAYIQSQIDLGTIPPPGSEFVHSKKIDRKYLSNESAGVGSNSNAFDWCIDMIACGSGIPKDYLGFHSGGKGGNTRANAVVQTEPVAKLFESRRGVVENFLQDCARKLFTTFGVDAEIEVTFPDLVVQDRSAKLKDLALSQSQKWVSAERCAAIAAKELDISDYDFDEEQEKIKTEQAMGEFADVQQLDPLTTPGREESPRGPGQHQALGSDFKKSVKDNRGF